MSGPELIEQATADINTTQPNPKAIYRQLLGIAMAELRGKFPGWRGSKVKRVGKAVVEKWLDQMAGKAR